MTPYVALLRGINVGGQNKVAMADLRALAEELGYDRVRTYINSGNLLFEAPGTTKGADLTADATADLTHATAIGAALADRLGRSIDVAVRSLAELEAVVEANPYPDGDPKQVQVTFLMGPAAADADAKLAALATEQERYTVGAREIYVDYGDGLARSRLATAFAKVVGVSATSRNIRTCRTLVGLLQQDDV